MYDYKVRHDALTLHNRKRRGHRGLIRAAVALLAFGALFGAYQLGTPWTTSEPVEQTGSDIIPLTLPPKSEHPQDSKQAKSEPVEKQRA